MHSAFNPNPPAGAPESYWHMPFGMRLGQLLAQAAAGGAPPAALAPFRIDRMTLQTRM